MNLFPSKYFTFLQQLLYGWMYFMCIFSLMILRAENLVTKNYYFELIETIKHNNTNLR